MKRVLLTLLSALIASGAQARDFAMFQPGYEGCYDRNTEPYTFVIDSHNHFRPFNGKAIPFDEMVDYMRRMDIYFVNIYGIGQRLPSASACTYYLNCPGEPVTPSVANDYVNADNIAARTPHQLPKDLKFTLSMTFPDLAKPEEVLPTMKVLEKDYPAFFTWMGELNVVKQALFNNMHAPVPKKVIADWAPFMAELRKRDMPISLHSDLGLNHDPTKYKELMDEVLELYPDNTIVWHHLGLSKELTNIDPKLHIDILSGYLDNNPKLYLDISWRVLYDEYFSKKEIRPHYVEFFNKYADRILPGTDFVASKDNKSFSVYKEEVEINSDIHKDLDDNAFRRIALGQNYFDLMKLPYTAPQVCP